MNTLIIAARVSFPPEIKTAPSGDPFVNVNLAHSKKLKDGTWESTYIKATAWRYQAQVCQDLQKGDRVLVSGPIKLHSYTEKKTGLEKQRLEMTINDVLVLKPREYADTSLEVPTYDQSKQSGQSTETISDDPFGNIPF